ncbi:carbon-nitrogen hydrolase family protein [Peribacillus frigoritolerans]|uniref:carbon-nitrogen hydrolase family protein n=1 Tax=Peribacillus frigoritolerans TaxID=450367 RepID=UPI0022268FBF|nr:carbon-nitrogen hydrolase family protein [Peribacillus frigoritolerans]UYY98650.1 carbon-nitrogen hydrolase family protein [Peribacillus frigoritolerans]
MLNFDENFYPQSSLRVAVAQATSVSGNIPENVNSAVSMIEYAAQKGADIIVFPEKFLTGYVPEIIMSDYSRYTITENDDRLGPIRTACKVHEICAIIGTPTQSNNSIYISSVVIDNSGVDILTYHKTHLFSSEKNIFKSDDKLNILNIKGWNIGLGICYDAGFSEHSRVLAQSGCHAYIVSSLFSKGTGYLESRIWFPARALDNTIYAVMVNHAGKTGVWDACGSSAIWNPFGQLIAEASETEPEVIIVDLDPNQLREARNAENMLVDSFDVQHNSEKIETIRMN